MHVRQPGKGAQSAAAKGQDLRAPRVINDARQGAVEVADYEQRPPFEVVRGHFDRRPYSDGRGHGVAEASGLGLPPGVSVGRFSGRVGFVVGASAEKSGTTAVIAVMNTWTGAPP